MEKVKILYLDDNPQKIAKFLGNFAQRYTVLTTTSPSEAVEFLKKRQFGVFINNLIAESFKGSMV